MNTWTYPFHIQIFPRIFQGKIIDENYLYYYGTSIYIEFIMFYAKGMKYGVTKSRQLWNPL